MAQRDTFVPNSIVARLLDLAVQKRESCPGLAFDSVPRTRHQARLLQQIMSRHGLALDLAIELVVDFAELELRSDSQAGDSTHSLGMRLAAYERNISTLRSFYLEMGVYVQVKGDVSIEEVAETVYRETYRATMRQRDRVTLT